MKFKPTHIVIRNSNSMTQDKAKWYVVLKDNDKHHIVEMCQTKEEADAFAERCNELLKQIFQ